MVIMEIIPPVIAVPAIIALIFFTWYIGSFQFNIFKGIIEQKAIKAMVNLMLMTILYAGVGVMAALVPRIFCFMITTVIIEILLICVIILAIPTTFLWTISAVQPGKIKIRNLILGFLFMGLTIAPMITIMRFHTWGIGINCLFNTCGSLVCP